MKNKYQIGIISLLIILFLQGIIVLGDQKSMHQEERDIWYAEAAAFCLENELIYSHNEGKFNFDEEISREELAVSLWRMNGKPDSGSSSGFSDVQNFPQAFQWVHTTGIMTGYNARIFGTADAVTREQMAIVLYRYDRFMNEDRNSVSELPFEDSNLIAPWAAEGVFWAVEKEIITGYEDNTFKPKSLLTKAEAAIIFYNYINSENVNGSPVPNEGSAISAGLTQDSEKAEMTAVEILVDSKTFTGWLYDNETAQAFISYFPLTITMSDLNHNEKFYNLNENLPAAETQRPNVIHAGEIMCWNQNTVVLFYDTFSNSYGGYVPLGYIEDTSRLANALGSSTVTITFTLE